MAHPGVNGNEFYGGFSSRVSKTVDQPIPKAFRNQSRRGVEPALRRSTSMEEVFSTAGGCSSPSPLAKEAAMTAADASSPTPAKNGRLSSMQQNGLSASGRKTFATAASLIFPDGDAAVSPAVPVNNTGRRTATPPVRSVSPTGRRTFYALPNSPCNETEYRSPSGGKGHFLEHPNASNEQIRVVMDRAASKSPLNCGSSPSATTRRSADRKNETTIDVDSKYFSYTGGKRCPSPRTSLVGILNPDVPRAKPTYTVRAPFATD